ncbi:hypothetical protein AK812_SmicGene46495, partial [Symbiodinium microadriaticum]
MKNELLEVVIAMRDYIDALPSDVVSRLPAMPGFDRDWANEVIDAAQRAEISQTISAPGAVAFREQIVKYVGGLGSSVIAQSVVEAILSAAKRSEAKDIENRSWNTHQRGPVLIHASAQLASKADMEKAREILRAKYGDSLMLPERKYLSYGAIVGVATITGCVEESESPWFFGPKGFTLADAKTLKPVSIRGRLSFFETGGKGMKLFPINFTDEQ